MYYFAKFCRFCLANKIDLCNYNIVNDNTGSTFYEQITEFVPNLKSLPREKFPELICTKCISTLNVLSQFKETCIKSQELLSTYNEQLKIGDNWLNDINEQNNNDNDNGSFKSPIHIKEELLMDDDDNVEIKQKNDTEIVNNFQSNNGDNTNLNVATATTESDFFHRVSIKEEFIDHQSDSCENTTRTSGMNYSFLNGSLNYEEDIKEEEEPTMECETDSDRNYSNDLEHLEDDDGRTTQADTSCVNVNSNNPTEDRASYCVTVKEEDYVISDDVSNDSIPDETTTPSSPNVVSALAAQMDSLNKKSRKRYEISYNQYMKWRETKNISSRTPISEHELLVYFQELIPEKKPNSVWTQYSMLRSTLSLYHNVYIDKYFKLKELLKRNSDGYKPKKSKSFTIEEVRKFIQEAPDVKYLFAKVALVFGIIGACGKEELCQLMVDDITDLKTAIIVHINNTNFKKKPRSFTVTGEFYNIYKKYAVLRPAKLKGRRFFLNYHNLKCTSQPIGVNKFGCVPKQIATYLGLKDPELYNGHCFRRSSAVMSTQMPLIQLL